MNDGTHHDLSGKRALIAGASRGIGAAIAHRFARGGASRSTPFATPRSLAPPTHTPVLGMTHECAVSLMRDSSSNFAEFRREDRRTSHGLTLCQPYGAALSFLFTRTTIRR